MKTRTFLNIPLTALVLALFAPVSAAFAHDPCDVFVKKASTLSQGGEGGLSVRLEIWVSDTKRDQIHLKNGAGFRYSTLSQPHVWKEKSSSISDSWVAQIDLPISYPGFAAEYEGVFFADTESGERLWIHSAKDEGNFFITNQVARHLTDIFGLNATGNTLPPLLGKFDYLNPNHCH